MEGGRWQWMLLYILQNRHDARSWRASAWRVPQKMRTRGSLSVVKASGDSLWHKGWGDSRRQFWSCLGAREEMLNGMLEKGGWPPTFPTAPGVRGLPYLQWETFSEVKGCRAQHTRRTMHTKDVFGDRACRESYEPMNNIKWRQNPNEDLNIFLGVPVTAKNWKYDWEKGHGF